MLFYKRDVYMCLNYVFTSIYAVFITHNAVLTQIPQFFNSFQDGGHCHLEFPEIVPLCTTHDLCMAHSIAVSLPNLVQIAQELAEICTLLYVSKKTRPRLGLSLTSKKCYFGIWTPSNPDIANIFVHIIPCKYLHWQLRCGPKSIPGWRPPPS